MARSLNSPVGDQVGEFYFLYEIEHSGGASPLRVTNAPGDVTALSQIWTAVGGILFHDGSPETTDRKGQGADLTLWGVDQTIIQQIQNNQFRGRMIRIYLYHPPNTPDPVFIGRQNDDYRITETRDLESNDQSSGRVEVTTRITADIASINQRVSTRCNVHSHEDFLRRAGVVSPDDKFFERLPAIVDKDIYWGSPTPEYPRWGFSGDRIDRPEEGG